MDIFIDDDPLTDLPCEAGTIEEAVRLVQRTHCDPGSIVVGLRCDGLEIPPGEMEEMLRRPVASCGRLEIFTGTQGAVVRDVMQQAAAALDQADRRHAEIAEMLTSGRVTEGVGELAKSLDIWRQVHDAIAQSLQMLGLTGDEIAVGGRSLIEVVGEPKELLLTVKSALEAQDYVLLADVLQYEFGEAVANWQAIIAEIARRAEEFDG